MIEINKMRQKIRLKLSSILNFLPNEVSYF